MNGGKAECTCGAFCLYHQISSTNGGVMELTPDTTSTQRRRDITERHPMVGLHQKATSVSGTWWLGWRTHSELITSGKYEAIA